LAGRRHRHRGRGRRVTARLPGAAGSGLTSLTAVVVFVFEGMVAWPPTVAMMASALVGGFLG